MDVIADRELGDRNLVIQTSQPAGGENVEADDGSPTEWVPPGTRVIDVDDVDGSGELLEQVAEEPAVTVALVEADQGRGVEPLSEAS